MSKIIVIENLPNDKTTQEVTELLAPLGKANWVFLKNEADSGKTSQFAYVEMSSEKEAAKVLVKWNGAEYQQRILRVKYVDENFDRVAALSAASWKQMKPPSENSTHRRFLNNKLDQRNLADLARQLDQEQKQAELPAVKLTAGIGGVRWITVALVMMMLALLIYASYILSR